MEKNRRYALNLFQALLIVLGIVAVQNLLVFVFRLIRGENVQISMVSIVALQFLSYLIVIYLSYWHKGKKFNLKPLAWVKKQQIFLLAVSLAFFVSFALAPLVDLLPQSEKMIEAFNQMGEQPVLLFFTMIFFAPMFEELIFRGILLKGLMENYSTIWSVLLTSLAFGAFHLNWQQFVVASVVGVFCSLVFIITGSLFYSILFHASYNFMVSFVTGFQTGVFMPFWVRGFLILLSAMVVVLQLYILYYSKPEVKKEVYPND